MRQQGRISDWKDDRGFGFITPQGGGTPIFVHVSAFDRSQVRPLLNAEVTYDVQVDPKKGPRAVNVSYVGGGKTVSRQPSRAAASPNRKPREHRQTAGGSWRNSLLAGVVLFGLGSYAWQQISTKNAFREPDSFESESPATAIPASKSNFVCEGKQHCSQMRSCEEAQFYVANCPNTMMDGDGDGNACEDRCGH